MELSTLLHKDLIWLKCPGQNKLDLAFGLLDRITSHFGLEARKDEIRSLIVERENQGGTTLPSALAIPHARIPQFDGMMIGVAVPETPFHDNDQEVKMVALLLTSEENPQYYLSSLAAFAKLSMRETVFESLLTAATTDDFFHHFSAQGFRG